MGPGATNGGAGAGPHGLLAGGSSGEGGAEHVFVSGRAEGNARGSGRRHLCITKCTSTPPQVSPRAPRTRCRTANPSLLLFLSQYTPRQARQRGPRVGWGEEHILQPRDVSCRAIPHPAPLADLSRLPLPKPWYAQFA